MARDIKNEDRAAQVQEDVLEQVDGLPKKKKNKKEGEADESVPAYKMVGESKIPVSKAHGSVWKSRKDCALAKRKHNRVEEAWDEAIKYYNHDQLGHRDSSNSADFAGNAGGARRLNSMMTQTENIVFANVSALVPVLYAKNPRGEFTSESKPKLASVVEDLVNTLVWMKAAPGVNLKPKARRCVVMTSLTNKSYIELGWNFKDVSLEVTVAELERLGKEYANAKDPEEIKEIEGKLQALEKRVDVLNPSGPWAKFLRPHDVIIDPDSIEEDLSDAQWIMIRDFMSTEYIKAVFAQEEEEGESEQCYRSIYEPTHIIPIGHDVNTSLQHEIESFKLIDNQASHKKYGFEDDESYRRAQRTEVMWVWDKTTRRVFLYNAKDWKWPLWVWDDPLKLDTFFPVEPLIFHTNPEGGESKGEVTYYLDQQDEINEINDQRRRARIWAKEKIIYDKSKVGKEDLDKLLKSDGQYAVGVDIPDGQTIKDIIYSVVPPSMNYLQLFDTNYALQAINRISSVKPVLQGSEFKTNTTNRAIAAYEATASTRLDEKIDAIEDMLGNVFWKLAQMCLMNMDADEVSNIIGRDVQGIWENMTPQEIRANFGVRVVGGSTEKPTSQAKKREALEVAQIMGQFAGAAPQSALRITLKMFEQAFDEIVIKEEDWESMNQEVQAVLQRGNSMGQQAATPTEQNNNGEVKQGLEARAQQAIQRAVSQGVPEQQARQMVVQRLAQNTQQ